VSDSKEMAGPILGFVGGLVILIYGAVEVYLAEFVSSISSLNGLPVLDIGGVLIAGFVGIGLGLLIMVLSGLSVSYPEHSAGLGVLMILFSIFSLVSVGGGNGVGLLLGVLGGTCCIVFAPDEARWSPPRQQSSTTPSSASDLTTPSSPPVDAFGRTHQACPRCGTVSPITSTACPSCGQIFSGVLGKSD
jgi:hypothetical protein